jgi:2-hydroxy-3-keto-5-methylthiopentenyl-1-phosphate phosphatase
MKDDVSNSPINNQPDYLNNLTVVTSTRDNIIWVRPFLKSFYQTVSNSAIPIIIVDASTAENYQALLELVKDYQNVQVVTSPDTKKHWTTDWEYGIKQCTTKYILHCHIDIIFLLKHWDAILPELLQTHVIVSSGKGDILLSSFILTTTDLLAAADCKTCMDHNNNYRELDSIIRVAHERGNSLILECISLDIINKVQYGDIWSLNNVDIYYHSYYSSRVYNTTSEPIPETEYITSNVKQRNLEQIPSILLKYLDSSVTLKDFLTQFTEVITIDEMYRHEF